MNFSETYLLKGLVVLLSLCAISVGLLLSKETTITQKNLTNQIKRLKIERDSLHKVSIALHDELYATENELSRYQYTLDFMKQANPVAANQFEEYMQTQTE